MSGFRSKRDKQYNRRSGEKDQLSRGGGGGGARYQRDRNRRNKQFDQGGAPGGGRVRRQSNEDYQRRDYGDQSRVSTRNS